MKKTMLMLCLCLTVPAAAQQTQPGGVLGSGHHRGGATNLPQGVPERVEAPPPEKSTGGGHVPKKHTAQPTPVSQMKASWSNQMGDFEVITVAEQNDKRGDLAKRHAQRVIDLQKLVGGPGGTNSGG